MAGTGPQRLLLPLGPARVPRGHRFVPQYCPGAWRASAHPPLSSPQHLRSFAGSKPCFGRFRPSAKERTALAAPLSASSVSPEHMRPPQAVETGTLTLFGLCSLSAQCKSAAAAPRPQLSIHSRLSASNSEGTRAPSRISKPHRSVRSRAAQVKVRPPRVPADRRPSGAKGHKDGSVQGAHWM